MFSFYKSTDTFQMMILLLKKAREKNLTVNVLFENYDQARLFSQKIWNMHEPIAHGLDSDGFIQKQPILLSTIAIKKNIALVLRTVDAHELNYYQKVFFIGNKYNQIIDNAQCKHWEYASLKWTELTCDKFWSS